MRCILPYVDELSFSTSAASSVFGTETVYRLNSLFDTYFPVGGHQPYGFDQITPFYSYYTVDRVDLEITFSNPSADGLVVATYLKNFQDTNTLVGATIGQAQERPQVWVRNLNDTGSQVVTFRKSVDLPTMVGLTRTQYHGATSAFSARVTADPAQTPYVSMAVANSLGTAGAETVHGRVRLAFHATFFGRITVPQS